jgi:hypothetical protein
MSREAVWAPRTNLGALEKKSLALAWNRFTFPRSPSLYSGHYTVYTVHASYRPNIVIIIVVVVVVVVVTTNIMSLRYSRPPTTP